MIVTNPGREEDVKIGSWTEKERKSKREIET